MIGFQSPFGWVRSRHAEKVALRRVQATQAWDPGPGDVQANDRTGLQGRAPELAQLY